MEKTPHFCYSTWNNKKLRGKIENRKKVLLLGILCDSKTVFVFALALLVIDFYTFEARKVEVFRRAQKHKCIYRRFNAIVSQLKMHYFSEGAFESLIASQLLKKEKIYLIILISKQCMENYKFPTTYTAISGLLDDVDNSKQWNFELWHHCIKATIYTHMFMYVNASIQICGNGLKQWIQA